FDLGEKLGTFATMTDLIRTEVGKVKLQECFTLEEMEAMAEKGDLSFLQGVEEFFGYPRLELIGEENLKYYKNGNNFSYTGNDGYYSIYYKNEFIGLATIKNSRIQAYKYF
ncbi:MAG: tRNA pseudouridine(55) synthase TruB, partial [Fusobacteriaceae bacterium]